MSPYYSLPDAKAIKKPYFTRAYGLLWTVLDFEMVEAGGIEPPSERFQSKVSTCLSSVLNLAWTLSQRQDGV